ncbi:MAG: alkaline phosphatase family protein [Burkholderiaceae bacterium]|nr:alkaline phosphatase family protein [Burkholderiaceae bacterium]
MSIRNVLFIMCDQLRWDHLSCYGHPHLETPNIDALARRGVLFENAFVQAGVCVPSRMSYYTGRYVSSHCSTYNRVPLPIGERTLGEYLRDAGRELVLAGKTHVIPDEEGLARLDIDGQSELGVLIRRGSFVEVDRYDGHHEPHGGTRYGDWLRSKGYASEHPWTDYVISVVDDEGSVRSGWNMRYVKHPSRVKEEHSETAYMTDQAIRFIEGKGDEPWALHLSYVKPHWPYVAPAPYHAMYTPADCLPVVRTEAEKVDAHPVLAAYRRLEESVSMATDEAVATVRPAYQGLIKQLDDHIGRLWQVLERTGRDRDTLVIFTADHGDFLGDHWLGEKDMFYDTVQRVPFIAYDPSSAADATRGTREERFVESVDVVPTILDAFGLAPQRHRVEGVSLLPLLRGGSVPQWRDAVVSELDYSFKEARLMLGRAPDACHGKMIRDHEWKYVWWQDLPPMLYNLREDPLEMHDLGRDPRFERVRERMKEHLFEWLARCKRRTTITLEQIEQGTGPAAYKRAGVFYGVW